MGAERLVEALCVLQDQKLWEQMKDSSAFVSVKQLYLWSKRIKMFFWIVNSVNLVTLRYSALKKLWNILKWYVVEEECSSLKENINPQEQQPLHMKLHGCDS